MVAVRQDAKLPLGRLGLGQHLLQAHAALDVCSALKRTQARLGSPARLDVLLSLLQSIWRAGKGRGKRDNLRIVMS